MEDGYMGSGKRIKNSIKKHGLENHVKEILEFLEDRHSLKEREKEIINEELLKDSLCMNLQLGGGGGLIDDIHKEKWINAGLNARQNKLKEYFKDSDWVKKKYNKTSDTLKQLIKDGIINPTWKKNMKGLAHSDETRKLMSKLHSGSNNSQFGKTWITNGQENKKIWRGSEIPEGWKLGRKLK
jgi:hypothetical protein